MYIHRLIRIILYNLVLIFIQFIRWVCLMQTNLSSLPFIDNGLISHAKTPPAICGEALFFISLIIF